MRGIERRVSKEFIIYNDATRMIILINLFKSNAQSADGESDNNVVNVNVYYEALCSDSMRWIVNQLVPSYPELKRHIHVTFVPYGKATVSDFIIATLHDFTERRSDDNERRQRWAPRIVVIM